MKKVIKSIIILIIILLVTYYYREDIYIFYNDYLAPNEKKQINYNKNQYFRDYNFTYFQNTTNFLPQNKDDIKNIFYSVINSGMDEFTFYCPNSYKECTKDINDIANDQNTISTINNFVHPYNSFKSLKTEIDTSGKIVINIEKLYDEEMITITNYKIDEIINEIISNNDNNETKIKKIHNYIINNTQYDKDRSDKKIINYKSDNAYGVLIEHYGICGGYTDTMMLFLEKLNIKSIKISNDNHTWNYVYLNDKWLHLDLTWDDPISKDDTNILDDTYFLITDNELKNIDKDQHLYNQEIYKN